MSKLSRRSFLKGAAAGAMGAGLLGLTGLAAAEAADENITVTGGETAGVAVGQLDGEVDQSAVMAGFADPEPIQYDYVDLEKNTDIYGKETYYSMRRDWLGTAPVIPEALISEELSCDVVVIGANYSGAPAFRKACEQGATCIVIDAQQRETFSSYGGEMGHLNSTWQEDVLGIPKETFTAHDFISSYQKQCGGRAQPDLLKTFANRSGELVDWMFEVYPDYKQIKPTVTLMDNWQERYSFNKDGFWTYPTTATLYSAGFETSAQFCLAQVDKGLEASPDSKALYGMEAKVLIRDEANQTVCGVICMDSDEKYYRIMARKGVILATGDFSSNSDMYSALCTEVQETNPHVKLSASGRNGYGHKMGIWAGAVMEIGPRAAMGGNAANPMGGFDVVQTLWTNKYGKRFCNECFGTPFIAGTQGARQPIGSNITYVFDDGHWRELFQNQNVGHMNSKTISDEYMDTVAEKLAAAKEAGDEGYNGLYCADTLEHLAELVGYQGEEIDNFVAAVARYNEHCAAGYDDDYGTDACMLHPITDGPFYAQAVSRSSNMVLVTLAGLYVDGNGQCLDQNFEPIKGLFAVGNVSGGRFPLQYTSPMNGISIGMAAILGAATGEYVGGKAPVVSTGDSATSAKGTADIAVEDTAEAVTYKDGTYEATATGFGGEVKVTIVV